MAEPYISLLGWRGDTAIVNQVTYACCVVDSTEELLLVTSDSVIGRPADAAEVPEVQRESVFSNRGMQRDGSACVWLELAAASPDSALVDLCIFYGEIMEHVIVPLSVGGPPDRDPSPIPRHTAYLGVQLPRHGLPGLTFLRN